MIDLVAVSPWDHGRSADLVVVPQQWHRRAELIDAVASSFLGARVTTPRRLVVAVDADDHEALSAASAARRRWHGSERDVVVERGRARD